MATISGNVCNTYVHIDLILTETGTNVDKNTSTVSWKLVGYLGSGASSSHWYSNSYHSINVSINGSTVYSLPNTRQKAISIGTNTSASSPVTIASGTTTVPHNADGSKTCACSFSVVYRYNSAFTWKGSGNVGLTTIARASQPSCITYPNTTQNVGALGSTITIHMNSNSSNFRHTVRYAWGNKSGTIATNVQYNCQWKIPLDFANNIPSATSGWGTIYVDTYNGSKLIGTKSVTFRATVTSSMVPSISSITCTDPKGYLSKYGGYVQNKSTLKVVVSASGSYSSSIKSYKIVANGVTYTANSPTTGVLISSGINTITVTVTDSRGRTVTKTTTISVLAYTSPTISYLTAGRCNSEGTADADGAYISASFKTVVTALNNKNHATAKLEYKKNTETSWTTVGTYTAYSQTPTKIFAANIDSSYNIRVTVNDDFSSATYEKSVGTVFTLIDFRNTGKGIALGKVSEEDLLDVNMDTRFRKAVRSEDDVIAGLGTSNQTSLYGKANKKWISIGNATQGNKIHIPQSVYDIAYEYYIVVKTSHGATFPFYVSYNDVKKDMINGYYYSSSYYATVRIMSTSRTDKDGFDMSLNMAWTKELYNGQASTFEIYIYYR
nr:MAG TPA: protein of unknown function DUF859 [Caudoviricetes sp.]